MNRLQRMAERDEATELYQLASNGEQGALGWFYCTVYDDLVDIAKGQLGRWGRLRRASIESRDLVHETYIIVSGRHMPSMYSRKDFFLYVTRVMRHLLIDSKRRQISFDRACQEYDRTIRDAVTALEEHGFDVDWLDRPLEELWQKHADLAHVFVLRYLAGMKVADAAAILEVDERTIKRRWKAACAWLRRRISSET